MFPFCMVLLIGISAADVAIEEALQDEGQAAWKITTPDATFFYQPDAGGFSSLLDRDGNDWISFNRSAGSSGMYRGIPNMSSNTYHPGYKNCTSSIEARGPEMVKIVTVSKDGRWRASWEIFDTHATLTVEKKGATTYWFLYEGTPGGKMEPESDFWVLPDGTKKTLGNSLQNVDIADIEGICFGDKNLKRLFFLLHHEDDKLPDSFWQMQNNMTVFGFGRGWKATPLLTTAPQKLSIGFVESGMHGDAIDKMEAILRGAPVEATRRRSHTQPYIDTRLQVRYGPSEKAFHVVLSDEGCVALQLFEVAGQRIWSYRSTQPLAKGNHVIRLGEGTLGKAGFPACGIYVLQAGMPHTEEWGFGKITIANQ